MTFEELVLHYGVLSGRRYTETEKLNFLANITREFEKLGYESKILKKDLKRFKGINCYIGDVVNAKNLIVAHYDTPLNSFDKNMRFYPFDVKRSEKALTDKARMRGIRVVIVGMFIMFFSSFFLKLKQPYLNIFLIFITVVMTTIAYLLMRGAPNPVNANLNTSGVLALLELAKAKPLDTAFILTDRECIDNLGDLMVSEALPNSLKDKNVIHLKAIGNGEHIVLAFSENNQKLAKNVANKNRDVKLYKLSPAAVALHSLNYYPNAISISVANLFEDTYEILNVANDQDLKVDKVKFDEVIKLILDYLNKN